MRILVLTSYWPVPDNPITGIFVAQQVEEFVNQGHSAVVIAPVPFARPKLQRPYFSQYNGAKVFSPRFLVLPGLSRFPSCIKAFATAWTVKSFAKVVLTTLRSEGIIESFDVIHINGILFPGLALPRLENGLKQKSVITVHGEDLVVKSIKKYTQIRETIMAMWESVSCVALVGAPLKNYMSALEAPENKLIIVPNGTKLPGMEHSRRNSLPGKNATINLISVSNLNRTKGIHFIIEAIRNITQLYPDKALSLTIVGDGPERTRLEKLVEKIGLKKYIHFTGRLPHDRTMSLVGEADIFVLPSYVEAFGIVYIEAMVRGVPVIGCEGTGAADIITDRETGFLVKQQDVEDLTTVLIELIDNHHLRTDIGERGRKAALRFTWANNVKKYIELFHQIDCSVDHG